MAYGSSAFIDPLIPNEIIDLVIQEYGIENLGFGYFCQSNLLLNEYMSDSNRVLINDTIKDKLGMYDVYIFINKNFSKYVLVVRYSKKYQLLNNMNNK